MSIPEPVLQLIEEEQIKQDGNFIPADTSYLEKIATSAELLIHQDGGKVLGYVFFYCNNPDKSFSYITLIGTSRAARGKGIGFGLLQSVLGISKARGFHGCRLEVRKENFFALNFYNRAGFSQIDDHGDKLLMGIDF